MLHSCLYSGRVRHRRFGDPEHEFTYGLFLSYLDLSELPRLFDGRWLWSHERSNLASFRRSDYLGDPSLPLDQAVRALVAERTGCRPQGPIRLLTSLRYWGLCFNPVSLYYCYDAADSQLECIVAEITNTPWGERHSYVLPRHSALADEPMLRFRFPKAFHVSPFIDMDLTHDWRFSEPGERLSVQMENLHEDRCSFDATLSLERREWTAVELARSLALHPFMSGQTLAGIYWQALRLRLKGAPFHPHPKHRASAEVRRVS